MYEGVHIEIGFTAGDIIMPVITNIMRRLTIMTLLKFHVKLL